MRNRRGIGVGSVSLILLFSVLCLTVFALLTLYVSKSDSELAKKLADSTTAYYEADTRAERVLAELEPLITQGKRPELIDGVAISYSDSDSVFSYICPLDQRRGLAVTVSFGSELTVMEWRVALTEEWTPEDSIRVWSGDAIPQ